MKISYGFVFSSVLLCFVFPSCKNSGKIAGRSGYPEFYKIGHRGTRGLMPENTIPAMEKGITEGANTIEFDVHLSKDSFVLVYHDASPDPNYTTMPDGTDIPMDERKKYTFYQNNYQDIRKFVVGVKDYPAFPQQQHMKTYTPLLSELIDSIELYTRANSLPDVYYLLEIKSNEKTDGVEQPDPEQFMKLLMPVVKAKNLGSRIFIQSFDMRPLQVLHREYPEFKLGFLTDNKNATFEENITKLGFQPALYNPNYKLVTPELVEKCHDAKILIQPWTVNTLEDMKKIRSLGVDGIITDYPNLFRQL
jgi:glycerophosphoryl diester phosphodiesterase